MNDKEAAEKLLQKWRTPITYAWAPGTLIPTSGEPLPSSWPYGRSERYVIQNNLCWLSAPLLLTAWGILYLIQLGRRILR